MKQLVLVRVLVLQNRRSLRCWILDWTLGAMLRVLASSDQGEV
jgi:hypothetical protein